MTEVERQKADTRVRREVLGEAQANQAAGETP